jgi:hypothetical protein
MIQIIATIMSLANFPLEVSAFYFFLRMEKHYRHVCVILRRFVSTIQLKAVKVDHDSNLRQRTSDHLLGRIRSAGDNLWDSVHRIHNLSNDWVLQ